MQRPKPVATSFGPRRTWKGITRSSARAGFEESFRRRIRKWLNSLIWQAVYLEWNKQMLYLHARLHEREASHQKSSHLLTHHARLLASHFLDQSPGEFSRVSLRKNKSNLRRRSLTRASKESSRTSKISRTPQVKLAVARLQLKKLEEEQKLINREQELEQEKLQLELAKKMLNARVEVEKAQIEADFSDGRSGKGRLSEILSGLPRQTLQETVERYL